MRNRLLSLLFIILLISTLALSALLQKNGLVFFYWDKLLNQLKPASPTEAVVYANVDGDTIKVKINGKIEKVRLIGVDTPETVHPRKPVEYYGKVASYFTKTLLPPGSKILLTYDPYNTRDKYGRLLAYVWFKCNYGFSEYWILHNLVLILNGYGHAYTVFFFRDDYMELFRKAEEYARESKIGLWGRETEEKKEKEQKTSKKPIIAYFYEKSSKSTEKAQQGYETGILRITYLFYEGCNETIVIKNTSTKAINLSGWYLVSVQGNQKYNFPAIILKPGESISIHSGKCASGEYIWTRRHIWNDNGDRAELYDPYGNLVDSYYYVGE